MSMTESLREAIAAWLKEKPRRNLSTLARLSSVSYSTLRRIANAGSETSDDTALKIADVVMDDKALKAFAWQWMPAMAKVRTDIAYKVSSPENEELLRELLADKHLTPILLLASHREGTNFEEVRAYFGEDMGQRFNRLVADGVFTECHTEKGFRNWRLVEDIGSVSLEMARDILTTMAHISPLANDELAHTSLAHVTWESVNLETALAIFHAAVDFMRKVSGLVSDKANRGDVLIMQGTYFNVLKGVEAYK